MEQNRRISRLAVAVGECLSSKTWQPGWLIMEDISAEPEAGRKGALDKAVKSLAKVYPLERFSDPKAGNGRRRCYRFTPEAYLAFQRDYGAES